MFVTGDVMDRCVRLNLLEDSLKGRATDIIMISRKLFRVLLINCFIKAFSIDFRKCHHLWLCYVVTPWRLLMFDKYIHVIIDSTNTTCVCIGNNFFNGLFDTRLYAKVFATAQYRPSN